jgi:hypothetical protein
MSTVFLISCALLPAIKPAERAAETVLRCRRPFLDTPHRFVHAIEVSLPGGGTGTVLGITVFDPASKSIRSAVVTIEGFVLFDARYDKELHVYRALPPFNAERFAEYMMEDIRLIFLLPEERLADTGMLEDGSTICRYGGGQDKIVDVIVHRDDTWEIGTYRNRFERLRKINAYSVQDGIPGMLELTAFESGYYSLSLRLISSETVSPEEFRSNYKKTPDGE